METQVTRYFDDLESTDKEIQYEAYKSLLTLTEEKVDWAYEVWDQLLQDLNNRDNHKRSRAAQFLSNLAISDPEKRMLNDFPALWEVTRDPKFVTARHSLQSIWRVGLAGDEQQELLLNHFTDRFTHCVEEKNYTLIRYDIIQGLRNLYDDVKKGEIKQKALDLIATEEDSKYQKKYATVWRNT
ncbi:hypothetical protein CU633_16775 [Bacillus sp. V3-13]|uniref:hypothetical protein n=1 Tax=Bacillus sp. V3-13 TaxID=2053728 RepID=UPI000C76D2C0|nr:hypothetical protein [Bacillus sp. V3-13]PLR76239.1 hypothetical protein CU633_16775 [Bacillus sp. V3-13]